MAGTTWKVTVDGTAWVADNATVVGNVSLGAQTSVWYGTVLRGDGGPITIGQATNIQDGTVIHTDPGHPVRLGSGVSVGHRAVLHGCTIGDDVLVGMAAVVMNDVTVGAGSLIGAGALLSSGLEVPPGSLVLGMPARVRRDVSADELEYIRTNAATYVALAEEHQRHATRHTP